MERTQLVAERSGMAVAGCSCHYAFVEYGTHCLASRVSRPRARAPRLPMLKPL